MADQVQFAVLSRILHWTMAVMLIAMLFIGIAMVASLEDYHWLVSIHKPSGILILILVTIRLINRRLINPPPPRRHAERGSFRGERVPIHVVRADVCAAAGWMGNFALPLVGWGILRCRWLDGECSPRRAIRSCFMDL
jgi:cytochrome b561